MSKTFGELRAGDEVYAIQGSNVEIVKVSVAGADKYVWVTYGGIGRLIPSDLTSYHYSEGNIYCNIDDAIKAMKKICANALHDYRRASGALNKLETKKKMI